MAIPKLLSKTKLLRGYRCLKYLYLTIHQPQLEAPITPEIQALFAQGNHVGREARKYFPHGILIDNEPWDFIGAVNETRKRLAAQTEVLFEAAFEYRGCYARADIIQYIPATERWQIYEVKSTTKVKPEHIDDVGLQVWVMAKSGLPIEKIHVLHLNPACHYPDLSNLFKAQDITEEIRQTYLTIQPRVAHIITTLHNENKPDTDIGPHCLAPTQCGFKQHCWQEKNIPAMSIFNLPGIHQRKWELYQTGIIELNDPRLTDLSDIQQRIIDVQQTGQRFINHQAIREDLSSWQFPLIFLDFETINPAIPRYDGCAPFQHVPFQFSVHIWQHPKAELIHFEFLHDSLDDPRPALIPALLQACEGEGSIVAYYGQFEATRIQELADYATAHRTALLKLIDRIVDPLFIIRHHVYDHAFHGSFSLKKVAPALLGEAHGYDGMLIANGNDAQRAFEELISPALPSAKKDILKKAMLDYCNKDTLVLVELVKWLYEQSEH